MQNSLTMNHKLMNSPDDDKQNYLFCRIKLFVEKCEHYWIGTKRSNCITAPKDFEPMIKRTCL